MELLLVRHADAVAPGPMIDDGHRPLSARGRGDARELGLSLRRASVRPDAIVTSPLVRAVETAELIAVGLEFDRGLDVAVELQPRFGPGDVVEEVLLPRADLELVVLVGHEPQLGDLLGVLLHCAPLRPGKATAIRLSWDGLEQPARFQWLLHPGLTTPEADLAAAR